MLLTASIGSPIAMLHHMKW